MLYMLDTNTVSYLVHRKSAILHGKIDSLAGRERLAVSVITEAEILYGLALKPEAHRVAYAAKFTLAGLDILPWTSDCAAIYADLRAENHRRGLAVGNLDFFIAAHAIAVGAVLVTSDRALGNLSGRLISENWASDLKPN